jgi:polar amino acid transport system substrate-binding protein
VQSTRTTNRRRAAVAAGSALALTALAACTAVDEGGSGEGGEGGGSTLSRIQEAGTVNVAHNGEEPYSYEDGGELTGATIALDKVIFGELGVDTVEGTQIAWESLIPGLTAGRYDTVSAGMSILPDRCEQAAFAEPTLMYTPAFLVPEGNPDGLTDWQSVEGSDLTLAVTSGAIEDGYAQQTGVETITVGDSTDGLNAVVSGRADAFALTGISLRALAESTDEPVEATEAFVATIDGVAQVGAGAEVFRQDDTELLEAYNEQLAPILEDEAKWLEIMEPFGFTEAEFPPAGLTADMLCEGDLEKISDELGLDS